MPRILVVDDERDVLERCRKALEKAGHQAVVFADPLDALQHLQEDAAFDCMLVDLRMPEMDGGQFLEHACPLAPEAVPIVMTAYASFESAFESARKGAQHYITKPFTTAEMLHGIDVAIERESLKNETLRLRAERDSGRLALLKEQQRSHAVFESLADGVLVVDTDGQVVMDNPAVVEMLGDYMFSNHRGPFEEVIGHEGMCELIRESLTHREINPLMKRTTTEIDDKSYLVNIAEIRQGGETGGFVFTLHDITQLRGIEHRMWRFVSMAAHELRAPLSTVEGYFNLFLDSDITLNEEKREKYFSRIRDRMSSMRRLVDGLIALTRLSDEWMGGHKERYDLAGILEDAINESIQERGNRDIVLRREYLDHTAYVLGDGDDLVRMFSELIGNAFKFNRDGGEVRVILFPGENTHEVTIADTGIGIPEEMTETVFEEFARVKEPSTLGTQGAGLGLAIARHMVKAHFGSIQVSTRHGHGSVFSVFLPAVK